MKKLFIASALIAAVLAGCSDSGKNKEEAADKKTNEVSRAKSDSNLYFKDNVAKIKDVEVKIKDTKVIPVGEKGNEDGKKPLFAIWYDATNLTDKEIDPSSAWLAIFTAVQDNDPNKVNKLEVGPSPDEKHLDSQMEIIKKNGTVENSIAYEMDDEVTPVTLIANQGIDGKEIGKQDYEVK